MIRHLFTLLLISLLFSACDPDDPIVPNEEEVITTMTYTLTDSNNNTVVFSFKDLDGDGGNSPVVTQGTLKANTSYEGTVELLNEAGSPVENITEEVQKEADAHQFFYSSTVPGIAIKYEDEDNNGKPIGLYTSLVTKDAGNGTLTIVLRHQPNKSATNVANGDITNAGGETDIEVTFDVTVQ
ncbi:MAG: type 1 periplasmic binding fold superfamily protein [Saprospiraceae bacterium]